MAFQYHVLVVANRTAGSDELLEAMRARAERDDVRFTLLVPALVVGPQGREAARETMKAAVERLREAGLEVEGVVGQADPMYAVADAWDPKVFDEVIVSTLPGAASKWLQVDLPHRVAKMTGVQVTHVLSQERKPAAAEPVPEPEKRGVLSPLSVLTWGGGERKS
jgi:hypothetical protein